MTAIADSPLPNTPEWHELRHGSFNASLAAVLFDRHPYESPGNVAVSKLADEPVLAEVTSAMRRGTHMEAAISDWYAEEYGVMLHVAAMHRKGVMMASPDRWCPSRDQYIEIKTTSLYVDEPLQYWLDQCQAVMFCTDTATMTLVWVDATMAMQVADVDRDDEFITEMVERADRFMAAIELGMVPDWIVPQLTAGNVTTMYPAPVGEKQLSLDDVILLTKYGELKAQAKAVDNMLDEIKDDVARVLADAEAGVYEGETVVTWKATKPRPGFDQAGLKADHPDLFAEYVTQGRASRTFLPKYNKLPTIEGIGF